MNTDWKIERYAGQRIVYLMEGWSSPELYKIGCTTNVCRRYNSKAMRAGIRAVIPVPDGLNIYEAERMVHRHFADKLVNGFETFALTEEDVVLFKRLSFDGCTLVIGDPCGD